MMSEYISYEELQAATQSVIDYSVPSMNSPKVIKATKHVGDVYWRRVNTPEKYPVLYKYIMTSETLYGLGFLILDGTEGESFAVRTNTIDNTPFEYIVLHSHAINRWMERKKFTGTLEEAKRKILTGLIVGDIQPDGTDDTWYHYFDGGVFICNYTDPRIMHLRTYILNRQCSPLQRMKSLQSEKELVEYYKKVMY